MGKELARFEEYLRIKEIINRTAHTMMLSGFFGAYAVRDRQLEKLKREYYG